ncbi:MAG: shikimate kinase [Acidobacteriaceae bacterium]
MSGPASFPANPSRIILTGFMGAGKTTVGALLAERLGWDFVDSDRIVEARAGMTVAEIFEKRGETAFREMEAAAIRDAASADRRVVALGGGALELATTRDLVAGLPGALVVFLDAPLETLLARCAGHADGPVRPVLADRDRMRERWSARLPWYRRAHLTVDTAELSPEGVAECILQRLEPGIGGGQSANGRSGGARSKPGVPA